MPSPLPPARTRARVFNSDRLADADLFSTALSPADIEYGSAESTTFRITVCLDTSVVFRMHVTNSGNTVSGAFNSGSALVADAIYTFVHEVREDDTINYQLGGAAKVKFLYISEVYSEMI